MHTNILKELRERPAIAACCLAMLAAAFMFAAEIVSRPASGDLHNAAMYRPLPPIYGPMSMSRRRGRSSRSRVTLPILSSSRSSSRASSVSSSIVSSSAASSIVPSVAASSVASAGPTASSVSSAAASPASTSSAAAQSSSMPASSIQASSVQPASSQIASSVRQASSLRIASSVRSQRQTAEQKREEMIRNALRKPGCVSSKVCRRVLNDYLKRSR